MKKAIFKPLTMLAIGAITLFSCAGSNDYGAVDADAEPTADIEVGVDDTDAVVNTDLDTDYDGAVVVDYEGMFEGVADTEQYNVLALARMDPNLSTFVELVELSGLAPSFEVAGPVTLFAPTNEAFNQMPRDRYNKLLDPQNRNELIKVIQLHVLGSEVSAVQLDDLDIIERPDGEDVPIETENGGLIVLVGGAKIVKSDVEAQNGVLHVVNGLIEPMQTRGIDMNR